MMHGTIPQLSLLKAVNRVFEEHIKQYTELISWMRWYPDLFLDLIKPKTGGINLHFDQRVFLRCICRFVSIYGVFLEDGENMG